MPRRRSSSLALALCCSLSGLAVGINKTCPHQYRKSTGRCSVKIAFVPQEVFALPVLDGELKALNVIDFGDERELYADFNRRFSTGHVFNDSHMAGCRGAQLPCPALGYDVDVMAKIFGELLDWDITLVTYSTYPSALYAARAGIVDIGWFGAAITAKREACIGCPIPKDPLAATSENICCLDFSYPYFEGGLAVASQPSAGSSFFDALLTVRMLNICTLFITLLIVSGHIMWAIERRTEVGSVYFPKSYVQGVFQGIYWSCTTATTVGYGDTAPTTTVGKVFTMTWMFVGIVFSGTVAGLMSAAFTVGDLRTLEVGSLSELKGKRVCFVPGYYEEYMYREGGAVRSHKAQLISDCIQQLKNGDVDAVLYDKPLLDRYMTQGRLGDEFAVSNRLADSDYGVAFPEGSELVHRVSAGLLNVLRDGSFMGKLRKKWLGAGTNDAVDDAAQDEEVKWVHVIVALVLIGWLIAVRLIKSLMKNCCNKDIPLKSMFFFWRRQYKSDSEEEQKHEEENQGDETWRTPRHNMMEKLIRDSLAELRAEVREEREQTARNQQQFLAKMEQLECTLGAQVRQFESV